MGNYYKPGGWNVVCAVCGSQFKNDEVRKRWDGLIVCTSDYEDRHTLDFIRPPAEESIVPYVAPESPDIFVEVMCPFPAIAGMAGIGTAGCAVAGLRLKYPLN